MAHLPLNAERMRAALEGLDQRLAASARLVIGGGAAMVLAYDGLRDEQDV